MKTDELREKYLEFFESKGCVRQPSDVLVPAWDPSVLFTPAGMNQFKDHFLGKVKLDFTRATTCQKCLRTGDIDNVGRTAFHHTFFEMLGNFSFGDYFKEEAIHWAWEFLTDKKWLGIAKEQLSVTVYKDDDEAYGIWKEKVGVPDARITRMDEDENFWPASAPSQGPDGVCGPCSEIYYHLEDGSDVEIWNLVFTQFNRIGTPPDNLHPLPSKNIDTGMGLERTASVLQGVPTNYHIDSLFSIVEAASDVVSRKYEYESDDGRRLRRITDHARASVFAVHENVYPGNKDARYVIRRLIRRAVLDGYQMNLREPFLYKLVDAVAEASQVPYPELGQTKQRVAEVIESEEKAFFATIDGGMKRIDQLFEQMRDESAVMVPGTAAAELNSTYGVPPELLQTLSAEQNFTFDWPGYREAMDQHAIDSGAGQRELFQTGPLETLKEALRETAFLGYEKLDAEAVVKGIITGAGGKGDEGQLLSHLDRPADTPMRLVLSESPFYGESGGQIGDIGVISNVNFEFMVSDTQKHASLIVHHGTLTRGEIHEGETCIALVNIDRRDALCRAHSATHILHHALHENVGKHAEQQGSKVEPDRLRFDFTNPKAIPDDVLVKVEQDVLAMVEKSQAIRWDVVPLAEARSAGAMMLFGEKYPDPCRMVSMGSFSKELCGGTHLTNTSQVQTFEVVVEESVSTGTRRIEALTGARAENHRRQTRDLLDTVAKKIGIESEQALLAVLELTDEVRQLKKEVTSGKSSEHSSSFEFSGDGKKINVNNYNEVRSAVREITRRLNVSIDDVGDRIDSIIAERKKLIQELKDATAGGKLSADDLMSQGETVGGALMIVVNTPGANPNIMRGWIDQIRKKSETPTAILLASVQGGDKVLLVGGLSKDLVDRGLKAGDWVGAAASVVGGGGGGRPDMAQAGGKDPSKLPDALEAAKKSMRSQLAQ